MAKFTARGFSRALSDLARVPAQIAAPVARRLHKEEQRSFDAGTDPYGRPWAPLKPATLARGRHPPPLTDTRKGRNSVKFTPGSGSGINMTVGEGYMGIHQDGDEPRMAARKSVPEGVLPAVWRAIWQSELTKGVRKRLSGG